MRICWKRTSCTVYFLWLLRFPIARAFCCKTTFTRVTQSRTCFHFFLVKLLMLKCVSFDLLFTWWTIFREKNLQSLTRVYFVLKTLFRPVYVIVLACWPHLTHKWDFNQFLGGNLVIISRSTTLNEKYSVLEHGIATGNLFLRVSPSYDEERSW